MRPEAQKELLDRLLREGIKPHGDTLAEIATEGSVAVVLFEPGPLALQSARIMGWDGKAAVFRLPHTQYPALARRDPVTARWLAREEEDLNRMLVLMHHGSLLVNFKPDDGYWIEPGSTDSSAQR